jgi:hypothetical protein
MSILRPAAIGVLLTAWLVVPAGADELRLEFADGYVTLSAKDVPARRILEEWARRGQTRIVNVDKVPGNLVTLELSHVPERQALDIVLRSASGYMAAMRVAPPGVSQIDRIVVMPASTGAPRAAAPTPRPVQQPPMAAQDPDAPPFVPDEDDAVPPQMPGFRMPPGAAGENAPMPPNVAPPFTPPMVDEEGETEQEPTQQVPTQLSTPGVLPVPQQPGAAGPQGPGTPPTVIISPAPGTLPAPATPQQAPPQ